MLLHAARREERREHFTHLRPCEAQHDHGLVREGTQRVREEIGARGVGPVEVLHDEEDRAGGGLRREPLLPRLARLLAHHHRVAPHGQEERIRRGGGQREHFPEQQRGALQSLPREHA
jgi:hypothetical protein